MPTDDHSTFNPMTAPRYTEIPTFFRAPLLNDPAAVDIAILGVPFDGGVTNRAGARHGPREVRNQSSLIRTTHHLTRMNPHEACRVRDAGDVRFTRLYDLDHSHAEITAAVRRIAGSGGTPLSVGGDHSITLPILRGLVTPGIPGTPGKPLGLVHFDAHNDTWGEWQGSKFHHGAPFSRAVEEGLIDPKRVIQVGIRGTQFVPDAWDTASALGFRVMSIEEFEDLGPDAAAAEARRVIGDGPAYLSFDIDSIDPAFAPGTGTPEVGGATPREAMRFLRGLRGLDLVGGDVVEVSPPFDPSGNTALVGATVLFEILCLLAERRATKR